MIYTCPTEKLSWQCYHQDSHELHFLYPLLQWSVRKPCALDFVSLSKPPVPSSVFSGTFLVKLWQYGKLPHATVSNGALGTNLTMIQCTIIALQPLNPKIHFKIKTFRHLHQLVIRGSLGWVYNLLMPLTS